MEGALAMYQILVVDDSVLDVDCITFLIKIRTASRLPQR